VKHLSSFFE